MKTFHLVYDKNNVVGKTEDNLYSSFIEHIGRAVYGGIYLPGHPTSDKDGFRKDVVDAVKKANLSLVRYPGGNFVSGYFWEDGIGPKDKRPTKKEEAWKSIETNQVGIVEFMIWARLAGVSPLMAVNMGAGTTESARNLVEYCNASDDSKYANLRRKYGSKEPYNIKYWCLGNEMDGPWQIGHLSAEDYVKKAQEAARMMRSVDPSIKFVACGSSTIDMPTFPEWDRIVLDGLYDDADYLSVHQYFFESTTEDDYFASHLAMKKYLDAFRDLLNEVQEKHHHKKEFYLCFDEYNVWYNTGKLPETYQVAPPILEENQSMKDTLVFGGLTNSLLNNCDIVKISCLAQLVNVIAPIMTKNDGGILLNTIWYPFYNFCKYTRGEVLKVDIKEDHLFDSRFGKASYLSHSIVVTEKEVVLQLINYLKEDAQVVLDLNGFKGLSLISHEEMYDDDLNARNTFENPNRVLPRSKENTIQIDGDKLIINLNKLSYNFIRFAR